MQTHVPQFYPCLKLENCEYSLVSFRPLDSHIPWAFPIPSKFFLKTFHHFSYWLWLPSRTSKSFLNVTSKISFLEKAKCLWEAGTLPCMPGFLLSGSHPSTEQAGPSLILPSRPWVFSLPPGRERHGLKLQTFCLVFQTMVYPYDAQDNLTKML